MKRVGGSNCLLHQCLRLVCSWCVFVLDVRGIKRAEADAGCGAASVWLSHARRTQPSEETPVGGAHLAHANAVDDGVSEEVERRQEVNQVELCVE